MPLCKLRRYLGGYPKPYILFFAFFKNNGVLGVQTEAWKVLAKKEFIKKNVSYSGSPKSFSIPIHFVVGLEAALS